jgi:hypothetical protein
MIESQIADLEGNLEFMSYFGEDRLEARREIEDDVSG